MIGVRSLPPFGVAPSALSFREDSRDWLLSLSVISSVLKVSESAVFVLKEF